jgi:uncharacterized protein
MKLPSEADIEALHRKYAANDAAYQAVRTHCQIVWEIAEQLIDANSLSVDTELVYVGCMLHDIGVYRFEGIGGDSRNIGVEYLRHGLLGHDILQAEGFADGICRFASHHTGVGITKEDVIANNLPLPAEDLLAETPEERLVMYADKFNSKSTPPRFNSFDSYRASLARFGAEKPPAFDALAEEFGKPDLAPIAAKYGQPIV